MKLKMIALFLMMWLGMAFGATLSYTKTTSGVGASTEVAQFNAAGYSRVGCEIAVTTAALTDFDILARMHGEGALQTLYSVAADYTSPAGLLIGTSGDLTIIGAGSTGWFVLNTQGIESVQLKAASGGSAGVTVRCGGQ